MEHLERAIGRLEAKQDAMKEDVSEIKGIVLTLQKSHWKQAGAWLVVSAFTSILVSACYAAIAGMVK